MYNSLMRFTVYCHTCKINGKKYVGYTSNSLEKRWNSHVLSAKKNSNLPFHKAIRKYGEENFDHDILDVVLSLESANQAEILWIDEKKSHVSNDGYNCTIGGGGVVGYRHSDEQRYANSLRQKEVSSRSDVKQKRSASIKKSWTSQKSRIAHKNGAKKYWSDDSKTRHFREVMSSLDVRSRISRSTRDAMKSEIVRDHLKKSWTQERKNHARERHNRSVIQCDREGKVISIFESLLDAASSVGVSYSNISDCCRGVNMTSAGYVWKYADEIRREE